MCDLYIHNSKLIKNIMSYHLQLTKLMEKSNLKVLIIT